MPGLGFTEERAPIDETNPKRPWLIEELPLPFDLREFSPTALLFPAVTPIEISEVLATT